MITVEVSSSARTTGFGSSSGVCYSGPSLCLIATTTSSTSSTSPISSVSQSMERPCKRFSGPQWSVENFSFFDCIRIELI